MVFTKNNFFTKKLASQNNSSENGNESISVTTHFFVFFSYINGHYWKMDIYKCPFPQKLFQTQKLVFFTYFIVFFTYFIVFFTYFIVFFTYFIDFI